MSGSTPLAEEFDEKEGGGEEEEEQEDNSDSSSSNSPAVGFAEFRLKFLASVSGRVSEDRMALFKSSGFEVALSDLIRCLLKLDSVFEASLGESSVPLLERLEIVQAIEAVVGVERTPDEMSPGVRRHIDTLAMERSKLQESSASLMDELTRERETQMDLEKENNVLISALSVMSSEMVRLQTSGAASESSAPDIVLLDGCPPSRAFLQCEIVRLSAALEDAVRFAANRERKASEARIKHHSEVSSLRFEITHLKARLALRDGAPLPAVGNGYTDQEQPEDADQFGRRVPRTGTGVPGIHEADGGGDARNWRSWCPTVFLFC